MAHPMAGQAKASQKRRLGLLQAHAGKSHGSSSMYKKTGLPKKNAGSSTPMTISGGSSKKRPDRLAFGGVAGGKSKKRKPAATTNIIISHAGGRGGTGGGGGAAPARPGMTPVPVPRPVPVPVGAGPGGPPIGPGPAAMGPGPVPVRPPMAPPVGPIGAGGPPPVGPVPVRPPGMKTGGSVKKAAKGGFLKEKPGKSYRGFPHSPTTSVDDAVSAHKAGGKVGKHAEGGLVDEDMEDSGYKRGGMVKLKGGGSAEGVAVEGRGHGLPGGGSAEGVAVEGRGHGYKKGGAVDSPGGFRRPGNLKGLAEEATYGGRSEKKSFVKKRQMGGGLGQLPMPGQGGLGQGGGTQSSVAPPGGGGLLGAFPGRSPVPEQKGPPTVSGRSMIPQQPLTVPQPKMASAAMQKPAPGTTVGFKKGGFTKKHADEPEDRKLFGKMLKEKGIAKRKEGGFVPKNQESKDPGLEGTVYRNQGKGYAAGGSVKGSAQAGAGSGMGRLAHSKGKWPASRKGEG